MQRLNFVMVVHNHQPVGNFDHVLEQAYEHAYKPFLDVFGEFDLHLSLHLSGPLFDWLRDNHPEYINEVRRHVAGGRIEMIGGGYYEPVIAAIPKADAVSQIGLFRDTLEKTFGAAVGGAWLTERVWEPHLPSVFRQAGVRYLPVDDFHFLRAGIPSRELDGFYLTESDGDMLAVYPGSETLRYIIPFRTVDDIGAYFRQCREDGMATLVFADDGEKFGIWPETHRWVYEEGWLRAFFRFLSDNTGWIRTMTMGEHFAENLPKGCCYLPTTSYPELGEWALPADASARYKRQVDRLKNSPDYGELKPFIQGGQWKNFLAKYRESQLMHKKMLLFSRRLESTPAAAKKDLFRAQCNDAYWHGVFGGLYLPHLRRAVNSALVAAGKMAFPGPATVFADFDMDGMDEVYSTNGTLAILADPDDGGTVAALDYLPADLCLTDTLTRRREAYHLRLTEAREASGTVTIHDRFNTKEEGLEKLLFYDRCNRASFRVHVLDDASPESLRAAAAEPHAVAVAPYECTLAEKGGAVTLSFAAAGAGWQCGKEFTLRADSLGFGVRLDATGGRFAAVELNINLFAPDAPDRYVLVDGRERRPLNTLASFDGISSVAVVDEWSGVRIDIAPAGFTALSVYPVETVSLSEGGAERTFQGTCLVFLGELTHSHFAGGLSLTVGMTG